MVVEKDDSLVALWDLSMENWLLQSIVVKIVEMMDESKELQKVENLDNVKVWRMVEELAAMLDGGLGIWMDCMRAVKIAV